MITSMAIPVLLLNNTYEPLNVITVRRAMRLIFTGKGVSLEHNDAVVRCASREYPLPVVVKLDYYVKRPMQQVKFSKFTVLLRDHFTCQYCGTKGVELTIDHIIPKTHGGLTTWTNIVAACKGCNNAKSDRSVKEAGMKLLRLPREPRFLPYLRLVKSGHQACWDKYLFTESAAPYLVRDPLPKEVSRR